MAEVVEKWEKWRQLSIYERGSGGGGVRSVLETHYDSVGGAMARRLRWCDGVESSVCTGKL